MHTSYLFLFNFDYKSHSMKNSQDHYNIPAKYRRMENLHIVFWLLKDLSWAMLWRPLGVFMIIPTVAAAIIITWQTRNVKSELMHNLAVVFWIIANCYWMLTEFFSTNDSLRFYAIIPFAAGIGIIIYYYAVVLPKENREAKLNATSE